MTLSELVRALQRHPSVALVGHMYGYKAIRRAQKAGAIVLDGDVICLTEVGYLLSQATMPCDVADARRVRRLLAKGEQ